MKADMFLKLAPIKGNSVDAKHKDEIELSGINWAMALPAAHASARGSVGRVEIEELVLRKKVDAASPALHAHCCCGTAFEEAIVVKRKSGQVPLEYFKLTLKEVLITSIELQMGGGDDSDEEVIKLRFSEFLEEFVPQKADGSGGGSVKHGYNVTKCVKI
jgi:type VI secretion system secreted protein Hcp